MSDEGAAAQRRIQTSNPSAFMHLADPTPMYAATFIYATKEFDDAFHRLDQEIAVMARQLPGYLGEESWENATTGLVSNVYYWSSLEALQQLMQHPKHIEAKAAQAQWLAGYQVIISQVLRTYGDGSIDHLLPPRHADGPAHPSAHEPTEKA